MSGIWWFGANNWIDFTPGSYVGTGAYTMGVIFNPASLNDRLFSVRTSAAAVEEFFLDAGAFYGTSDFSSGFSAQPITVGQWYVGLLSKAAGPSPYRIHAWAYDKTGAGSMQHGVAAGAANHGDVAGPITTVRLGSAIGIGANGTISNFALWDRALSDAECDTLKTSKLQKWKDLNPQFLCPMNTWNGTGGIIDKSGTSTFVALTGSVDSAGAEPDSFDYTLGGGPVARTTGTVADNIKAALGPNSPLSVTDLLNQQLAGDIIKLGYNSAIVKNWGVGKDSVSEAKRRHYAATVPQTLQDAELAYWRSA